MSAVLNSRAAVTAFPGLLQSVAKGTFFLRFFLQDHTNDDNLSKIVKKASALYEKTITSEELRYVPHYKFRAVDADHVELVLCREGYNGMPCQEMGCFCLNSLYDADQYCNILVLPVDVPVQLTLH